MQPELIITPFGESADPATIRDIPQKNFAGDPRQNASWEAGFPIVTMTPIKEGGIPPEGPDMNGVLRAISRHTAFTGGGGQYKWSSQYVAAKGGYPLGAVIQADNGEVSYVSMEDGNTTNFNTYPDSIGRQWQFFGGPSSYFKLQFDQEQVERSAAFNQFLANIAFEMPPIPFVDGSMLEISRPTQLISHEGNLYSVRMPATFPVILPGVWDVAVVSLTPQTDPALRQQLAIPSQGPVLLGTIRRDIDKAKSSMDRVIQSLRVNIWEDQFSSLITSKPSVDPGTWDWTPAFEAASLYVKSKGGGVVEFTAGTFSVTRIYRRNGVSIEARGSSATFIQALPFDPGDGKPYGLIEQEPGPVISSHFKGIHLLGNAANPDQWGMYLHAQWDATYTHGGLWMSAQEDVRITFFIKGIWSRGGYTIAHYRRPQQFLDMKSTYIQVMNEGEALRLTGQHGQILFTLGSAEGREGQTAERCVTMGFDPDPSTTAVNASGSGESTSDVSGVGNAVQSPINVELGGRFSMQKSKQGLWAQNARNIQVAGVWAENLGQFLTAIQGATVDVDGCHLAKCADGSLLGAGLSGYLFSADSLATVVVSDNQNITGRTDSITNPAIALNNATGLDISLTAYSDTAGKFKVAGGKTQTISAAGGVAALGHRYVTVSANSDASLLLKTLSANAAPNQEVALRAGATPFTLGIGGNISLNGLAAVTVPAFGVCILRRLFEVGASGEWALVSVTEHFSSGTPTTGYFAQGTRIWRSNPGAGSFMGVVCTTSGIAGTTAIFKNMANLAA